MDTIVNFLITILVCVIAVICGFRIYPALQPHEPVWWAATFAVGSFLIIVAEAVVDNIGLFDSIPKSQRLFLVATTCGAMFVGTLYYLARLHWWA